MSQDTIGSMRETLEKMKASRRQDMVNLVREWRAVVAEINEDTRLSHAGKEEKRQAAVQRYRDELTEIARRETDSANRAIERAAAELQNQRQAAVTAWDWQRLAVLETEAAAFASSVESWDAATAAVDAAIADNDAHAVRALQRLAVPELLRRARTDERLRQNNSTVAELRAKLDTAAEEFRPEPLRRAEAAYNAAVADAERLRADLVVVDGETAVALGRGFRAPGIFADGESGSIFG